jgi:hypothetical protein
VNINPVVRLTELQNERERERDGGREILGEREIENTLGYETH